MIHRIEFRITGHLSIRGDPGTTDTNERRRARKLVEELLNSAMSSLQFDAVDSKSYYLVTFKNPPVPPRDEDR